MFKYNAIIYDDTANGEGVGAVLFTQGCSHHCKGCHNPQTWSFEEGLDFNITIENELFDYLSTPFVSRLTLSGGDPIDNYDFSLYIAQKFKKCYPDKQLWLFTGYTIDDLYNLNKSEILTFIDVLIDGPFILSERNITLAFRGSENQNLYRKINGEFKKE